MEDNEPNPAPPTLNHVLGQKRAVQQLRESAIEIQLAPIRSSVHIPVATLWAHFQGGDVDKGLAELDPVKRNAIYVRMQDIMENTGAYVWITFDPWDFASVTSLNPAFDSGGEYRVELFKKA